MLIMPAKNRGAIDRVPFLSSTLSMIKMAIMEVKATVIYRSWHLTSEIKTTDQRVTK